MAVEHLESKATLVARVKALADEYKQPGPNGVSVLLWGAPDDMDLVTQIGEHVTGPVRAVCIDEITKTAQNGDGPNNRTVAWYRAELPGVQSAEPDVQLSIVRPGPAVLAQVRSEICVTWRKLSELTPVGGFDIVVVGHHVLRAQDPDAQRDIMRPVVCRLAPEARVLLSWSPLDLELAGSIDLTPVACDLVRQRWAYLSVDAKRQVDEEIAAVSAHLGFEVLTKFEPAATSIQDPVTNVLSTIPPVFQHQPHITALEAILRHSGEPTKMSSSIQNVLRLVRRPAGQSILEFAQECWPGEPPVRPLVVDLVQTLFFLSMYYDGSLIDSYTEEPMESFLPGPWWVGYAVLRHRLS